MEIDFEIDSTLRNNKAFSIIKTISIEKQDIFNYGIFKHPVPPEKIGENDFEYLQSKIPSFYDLYDELIDFQEERKRIESKVSGEDLKNISEIVGIAVGLKSAETILKLKKMDFHKIPPSKHKLKRLDFITTPVNNKKIEIETKGTAYSGNVNHMIEDIKNKKKDQTINNQNRNEKYGFVTLLQRPEDKNTAKIFATDPENDADFKEYKGIYFYINYYLIYFSFILDNMEYNKLARKLKNGKYNYRNRLINQKKLKYKFSFFKKEYVGQYFDKRLILEIIIKNYSFDDSLTELFNKLTKNIGKEKYFLGIDIDIIKNLNNNNADYFKDYKLEDVYEIEKNVEYIQMSDGVLFIKSANGQLKEIEEQFTEGEVKRRLGELYGYKRREPHQCGAACRSRDKKGKPCKKMTYREHCHFHR